MTPAQQTATRPAFLLLEQKLEGDAVAVTVSGELDIGTAPVLQRRLEDIQGRGTRRILLDLTEVSFIDSLSVASIVAAKRRLGPRGRMAVVARHPHVLQVFEIAGLDDVINLRDTYDEALAMAIGEQRG
jgi:anti-sigma B factor antagonist